MSAGGLPGVCPKCKRILKIRVENGKAVCFCPDAKCGYRYEDEQKPKGNSHEKHHDKA